MRSCKYSRHSHCIILRSPAERSLGLFLVLYPNPQHCSFTATLAALQCHPGQGRRAESHHKTQPVSRALQSTWLQTARANRKVQFLLMLLVSITAKVSERCQGEHGVVHQLSRTDRTLPLALILYFTQYCMLQAASGNVFTKAMYFMST